MRTVRFLEPGGEVRAGEWTDDGIAHDGARYLLDEVEVLPPCEPTKVVCVGANYREHIEEMGRTVPERPLLFLKGPNAVVPHGGTVRLLAGVERTDHEAELGVVVGERCRDVSVDHAMEVVAGYTCVNDVSNRDDQLREVNWVRGKAFDTACPLGPVVATPDEVPDDAYVRSRVNGELRQDGRIDDMVWGVAEILAEITRYVTLEAGDVVATGTPAGVGPIEAGDAVEIEVEGVGVLRHGVAGPTKGVP